jgi:hypothetical protein
MTCAHQSDPIETIIEVTCSYICIFVTFNNFQNFPKQKHSLQMSTIKGFFFQAPCCFRSASRRLGPRRVTLLGVCLAHGAQLHQLEEAREDEGSWRIEKSGAY